MGELAEELINEEMFGSGEDEDGWEEYHKVQKQKKENNLKYSLTILLQKGIAFKKLSQYHYRIEDYDFWPSTGKFMHMKTKERGRGVFNLIKKVIK